jgi:hypothetical protein
MNTNCSIQGALPSKPYSTEAQQFLQQHTRSFVGRQFVFNAFADFQKCSDRGYFTLVGAPGSGKTAFLSCYALRCANSLFYTSHLQPEASGEHLVTDLLKQLLWWLRHAGHEDLEITLSSTIATQSRMFSILLQRISKQSSEQPLVIAIDSIDQIAIETQTLDSNIGYLPRYLPPHIYFLLSRRPFAEDKARLLVEAPNHTLRLDDYPMQNSMDIKTFCQQQLKCSLSHQPYQRQAHIPNEQAQFCQALTAASENNFMYAREILSVSTDRHHPFQGKDLPSNLKCYYEQHSQRMKLTSVSAFTKAVLRVLVNQNQSISAQTISTIVDADEYDVEQILGSWIEFLKVQIVDGLIYYSFYHSSFRHYLWQKCSSQ